MKFRSSLSVSYLEIPDPEGIVNLVSPPADTSGHVAARWVPFNVGGHEMLCLHHDRHVIRVNKFQNSIQTVEKKHVN